MTKRGWLLPVMELFPLITTLADPVLVDGGVILTPATFPNNEETMLVVGACVIVETSAACLE